MLPAALHGRVNTGRVITVGLDGALADTLDGLAVGDRVGFATSPIGARWWRSPSTSCRWTGGSVTVVSQRTTLVPNPPERRSGRNR